MDFHEAMPWDPAAKSLAFRREGEVIHTRDVEDAPPRINVEAAQVVEEHPDLLGVEWTAEASTGEASRYIVRYSHNDGEGWRAVAAELTEPHYDVNLNGLPGGEHCRIHVIASSGIRTAVATTSVFTVPG
jgi:hypothetical protein